MVGPVMEGASATPPVRLRANASYTSEDTLLTGGGRRRGRVVNVSHWTSDVLGQSSLCAIVSPPPQHTNTHTPVCGAARLRPCEGNNAGVVCAECVGGVGVRAWVSNIPIHQSHKRATLSWGDKCTVPCIQPATIISSRSILRECERHTNVPAGRLCTPLHVQLITEHNSVNRIKLR